jgi:hypothetical protein
MDKYSSPFVSCKENYFVVYMASAVSLVYAYTNRDKMKIQLIIGLLVVTLDNCLVSYFGAGSNAATFRTMKVSITTLHANT